MQHRLLAVFFLSRVSWLLRLVKTLSFSELYCRKEVSIACPSFCACSFTHPILASPSMPRFLDTLTGRFVWRDDPANVVYAILSHTWRPAAEGGEQSYDDLRRLQAEVEAAKASARPLSGEPDSGQVNPLDSTIFSHPALSDKTKGICRIAREAGYRLVWNDACCIDKSSSAELTEAINSMFQWYRLADVCYVYLADVPDMNASGVPFEQSKWHRRGWTLQGLIAPKRVVFLNQIWCAIGTKFGLAPALEKITDIDFDVLTGRAALGSVSVARRMSWAARRETTRVEDRAYSLMGIFGVHMPTIYGEGSNAFLRLQEEIIKLIPDQSVFAWGRACVLTSLHTKDDRMPGETDSYGLLADSPSAFSGSSDIYTLSPEDFASRIRRAKKDVPSLHSVFTPQGVRIELLCIDLAQVPELCQTFVVPRHACVAEAMCGDCLQLGHAHVLALLQCEDQGGALIALPLCEPPSGLGNRHGLLVVTHINCARLLHQPVRIIRLTRYALLEVLRHLPLGLNPTSLSILRHYSARSMVPNLSRDYSFETRGPSSIDHEFWQSVDQRGDSVFRIAPRCDQELGMLGFELSPLRCQRLIGEVALSTTLTEFLRPDPRDGPSKRVPRGITELKITLIQNGDGYGDDVPVGATVVRFSITNQRCIIFPDTGKPPSLYIDLSPRPTSSHSTTYEMPVLVHNDYTSTSVSGVSCGLLFGARALASTVFVVYWGADDPGEQNMLDRRFLRLSLERSAGATGANDFRDLWVAVEISDEYWHWNNGIDDDGVNKSVSAGNHAIPFLLQSTTIG